jgi:hypothetical protein
LSHRYEYSSVWNISTYRFKFDRESRESTILYSASSDGSARCAIPCFVNGRTIATESTKLELFRIRNISSTYQSNVDNWNGSISKIDVGFNISIKKEKETIKSIVDHKTSNSINSIDSIQFNSNNDEELSSNCLVAYGGTAGLLRIHMFDILNKYRNVMK